MKNTFKLKALCAALAVSAATAASASQIYLDVGTNFTGLNQTGKVNSTSTGVKNEILYTYQSTTFITDVDGNGIDAGDLVSTSIGLFGTNSIVNNYATGFTPGQAIGTAANNGYNNDWQIGFKGVNLAGVVSGVNGVGPGAIPLLSYAAGGLIQMLLTFDGVSFNNFMNLLVGGGGATGVGTVLFGVPDFTGVDAGYNNLIHAANGANCGGLTGLQSLTTCNNPSPFQVSWVASQDTNVTISQFGVASVDQNGIVTYVVSTNHDGSLRFGVPEPSMLLLMGGALLGLGLSSRRRKQA
jgi:hypothetical protein